MNAVPASAMVMPSPAQAMPAGRHGDFAGRWRATTAAAAATDESPRVHLAGELHGLDSLRRALALPPDRAVGTLLIAAWQRWGSGMLRHLNGVFALAVESADRLVLYRDASSLASLYFAPCADGSLAFATRLQDVAAQPGVSDALSPDALHEYLRMGDVASPRTLFRDIFSVEPGCAVDGQGQAVELAASAWSVPAAATIDEAAAELEQRLLAALELRLHDAAAPGAFLSGGVDSALLAALSRAGGRPLRTWTVGFAGLPVDESESAARIARHLGLQHSVFRFDAIAWRDAVERLAKAADQPTADPATAATILSFETCRQHHDVMIDGTGADEAAGLWPPRHVRVAVAGASRIPTAVRRRLARRVAGWPAVARFSPVLDFDHPATLSIRWNGWREPEIEALCGQRPDWSGTRFFRTFDRFARSAHFERESALLEAMPCERLNQALRASPTCVRFPFTDPEVDRFLRALPAAWRHRSGEPKRILRAVLARHLPRALWDRPKHGFDFPLHAYLMADGGAWARRALDPLRWLRRGWRGGATLATLQRDWVAGDERLAFRVYQMVLLDRWLEHHRHSFGS